MNTSPDRKEAQTEARITRSSGDVFVDLGMTAEEGREVVRRKMAERAPQPTEAQMEAARAVRDHLCLSSECKFDKGCGCLEALSQALAESRDEGHREGMMRAAEIVQECAAHWREVADDMKSMGDATSLSYALENHRVLHATAIAILSEANPDQRGGYGPSLPVETATEERTACLSRPDPSEKPGSSSSPVTAAPGANPSQALGAPVATAASFSGRE